MIQGNENILIHDRVWNFLLITSKELLGASLLDSKDTKMNLDQFLQIPSQDPFFIVAQKEDNGSIEELPNQLNNNSDILTASLIKSLSTSSVKKYKSILALIKRKQTLELGDEIKDNIIVINIPLIPVNKSALENIEVLKSLIRFNIDCYFDILIQSGSIGDLPDAVIRKVKQCTKDILISFQRMQQSINIPQLISLVPSNIFELIDNLNSDTDIQLLNTLQSIVNSWVLQINDIMDLSHNIDDGSVLDEIDFWSTKEEAMTSIYNQLQTDEILKIINYLKINKRSQSAITLLSGNSIKESISKANKNSQFLKNLPYREIMSISNVEDLQSGITNLFLQMKKLKTNSYPIARALDLMQIFTFEIKKKLIELLENMHYLSLDFESFKNVEAEFLLILSNFDEQLRSFTHLVREQQRKRGEGFVTFKLDGFSSLKSGLIKISDLKISFDDIANSVSRFLFTNDKYILSPTIRKSIVNELEILQLDFGSFKIDSFFTAKGIETYDKRFADGIYSLEKTLIDALQSILESLIQNEMDPFELLEDYSYLFSRPNIRVSLGKFHRKLLSNVELALDQIEIQLRNATNLTFLIEERYIPSTSAKLVFGRHIMLSLSKAVSRLELLLSSEWPNYPEGKRFSAKVARIISELDLDGLIENWVQGVNNKLLTPFTKEKIIFCDQTNGRSELRVNLDEIDETLINEFKCMKSLQFDSYEKINQQYISKLEKVIPHALSLKNAIENFNYCAQNSDMLGHMEILLQPLLQSLLDGFVFMFNLSWKDITLAAHSSNLGYDDGEKIDIIKRIDQLSSLASSCVAQVQKLKLTRVEIFNHLEGLVVCEFKTDVIKSRFEEIQKIVQLLVGLYPNTDEFISLLNHIIKEIIFNKYKSILLEFEDQWNSSSLPISLAIKKHQIMIQSSDIVVEPYLEKSKQFFYDTLNAYSSVLIDQKRISGSLELSNESLFSTCEITDLPEYCHILFKIEEIFGKAYEYCQEWASLHSIWDFDIDELGLLLDDNLSKWIEFIDKIKILKERFDSSDTSKPFGLLLLDYSGVQSHIYSQYQNWQKSINQRFAVVLHKKTQHIVQELQKFKNQLAATTVNLSIPGTAICFLSTFKSTLNIIEDLSSEIKNAKTGHGILLYSKVKFPTNWIFFDQVQNELDSIQTLIDSKKEYVRNNLEILISIAHDDKINTIGIIERVRSRWHKKNLSNNTDIADAVQSIKAFEKLFSDLSTRVNHLINVYALLDLTLAPEEIFIGDISKELGELKDVWGSISTLTNSINFINAMEWQNISLNALKSQMEDVLLSSKSVSAKIKDYPAFQKINSYIKEAIRSMPVLNNLKNDSLKLHHWKEIFLFLGGAELPHPLTAGDILNLKLAHHEKYVKSILQKAQGEKMIDDSISSVNERWDQLSFNIHLFDNKHSIIAGWDQLFLLITEDLNTLSSIKLSPHFDRFSKRISVLETKLEKVHVVLNIWVDCQKQWVYLYGAFNENENIKSVMPLEVTRFENMSSEFKSIMKSVIKNNNVIDILNIPDVEMMLKRILETLTKVKIALSVYLENQRSEFPRFYFIGNDDLLELIGNSRSLSVISKHIKKMFVGVENIVYDEEALLIEGVISAELEVVKFANPVSLIKSITLRELFVNFEAEITSTLSSLVLTGSKEFHMLFSNGFESQKLLEFIEDNTNQIVCLALQLFMTHQIETAITENSFNFLKGFITESLEFLASALFNDFDIKTRLKTENFIVELIHYRDIVFNLIATPSVSVNSQAWFFEQKYYMDTMSDQPEKVIVKQGNSQLRYGYEYLGVQKKLAYTPLIRSSFIAMTEALDQNLGAMMRGPAGTGKTESVKALGYNLGRMVFVFCCDESFDYESVSRILVGISCVGAWCCFDEFNRLEETILSAISTQIEKIEISLGNKRSEPIKLLGKSITISKATGIFITNNPHYDGRSTLPDNLKNKYLTFNMNQADSRIVAEVIFSTQGFHNGRELSQKIIQFYELLASKCSKQIHYDFGLRSIKSVLITCGKLKRDLIKNLPTENIDEIQIVIQSFYNIILPKLIPDDYAVFNSGVQLLSSQFTELTLEADMTSSLKQVATELGLQPSLAWLQKAHQVYEIQKLSTGFILVGNTGSGKTATFHGFITALSKLMNKENLIYTIDPKVISKEVLFGTIDYATREWTDGIFTGIIRTVIEATRGEDKKNVWIVFDGDIDPNWVENLNSVLDDNKILTLPNGERLQIPENIKIVFEVDTLSYATPATISRCGIIWFGDNLFDEYDYYEKEMAHAWKTRISDEEFYNQQLSSQSITVDDYKKRFKGVLDSVIGRSVISEIRNISLKYNDVLNRSIISKWKMFFLLLSDALGNLMAYVLENSYTAHDDFSDFFGKSIVLSLFWSFSGGLSHLDRLSFETDLKQIPQLIKYLDSLECSLIYSNVECLDSKWSSLFKTGSSSRIDPHMVIKPDLVIPTIDTTSYENIIFRLLNQHEPTILCGPPGAGKTMLLLSSLRKSSDFSLVCLNFSKETTPDSIIKTLEHNCVYRMTSSGLSMTPTVTGKWIVVFCDEVNLPKYDNYGTQVVISFLRSLIIHKGFWHPQKKEWVNLKNVQFIGACNPPDGSTRQKLSMRFQNHCNIIMVDYPSRQSLKQIYTIFVVAILRCVPDLFGYADALTDAMIDVYFHYKETFNETSRTHYICSPRELTRWVRGLFHGLRSLSTLTLEGLVRLWAHEALRLFSDKLSSVEDRNIVFEILKKVAEKHFPYINEEKALATPILFSEWLSYDYEPIDKDDLRKFIKQKLETFCEEEQNTNSILFEDLLDHSLRIDRVLKSNQGHLMLIGQSGSGKTTLVKFVAWMNGIKSYPLNVFKGYKLSDFDDTLRSLLWKSGVENEKVCFIIDESTILEASFLERMNTLLANAEIPGLFQGEDYTALMSACSKTSRGEGLILESDEELYDWFTSQIANNFHVVFTMSDPYKEDSPFFIQSNALFNRCVINWMGDWSQETLIEVSSQLLKPLPIEKFKSNNQVGEFRNSIIAYLVNVTKIASAIDLDLFAVPVKFVDMVNAFVNMFVDKETYLQKKRNHTNNGLDKMREAYLKVKKLSNVLNEKKLTLAEKEKDARLVLDKMIMDQNESERKQDMSIEMQKLFTRQEEKIKLKRDSVMKELQEVEPLIFEAQQGVQNIKKEHLTEMRSMRNPPDTIKMVLESVCILLGYTVQNWVDVQQVVRQDDFITNIVTYDNETQLTSKMIEYMESHYLSQPNYNYDAANRASKALGPLLMWVKAQLRYASIVSKVDPLRKELKRLEIELIDSKNKLKAINGMIKDLQGEIQTYKETYSQKIREIESIKMEMETVEEKVSRSTNLLESLKTERSRWTSNIDEYNEEERYFIGDIILTAVFTIYCDHLTELKRNEFIKLLKKALSDCQIKYDPKYDIVMKLTNPGEVLSWQDNTLPNDEQFIQNTAILKSKYHTKYPLLIDPTGQMILFLQKSEKSMVITSFLDPGYIKQLENCVKFGGTILITDGEHYDPILNRLIANDIILIGGGRKLVKIGDKEIDYSPNFKLFVHTKDETIQIMPYLKSRMKILNFAFTNETLLNEALNLTLKSERPDVEAQRLELMKARDQYKERLRSYETDLLDTINRGKDNILDNHELANQLELLKVESDETALKTLEVEKIIETFQFVISEFKSLGQLYVDISNIVNSLWKVNKMYKFGNQCIKSIFIDLLQCSRGNTIEDLQKGFIEKIYFNLSTNLMVNDVAMIRELLSRIAEKYSIDPNELKFVHCTLEQAVDSHQFILMRSPEGFDPSIMIQQISKTKAVSIDKYSLGQIEGAQTAKTNILNSYKNNGWIIIENIDMSTEFVASISKLIADLKEMASSKNFKMFLTTKMETNIPSLIIESCHQIVFETQSGMKASLETHLINHNFEFNILQNLKPKELKMVNLIIIWFYSLIIERFNFSSIIFEHKYDINETDLLIGLRFARKLLSTNNKGEYFEGMVPFDSIKQMISNILVAGKIDYTEDKLKIKEISDTIFVPELFDGLQLVEGVKVPMKYYDQQEVTEWVNKLPDLDPLSWFGLKEEVRLKLNEKRSEMIKLNIAKILG